MISTKMKEDAAKISSEIKKIATKIPLAFLNYSYLNEDAKVVLHRRNEQLDGMQDIKEFLNDSSTFSDVLRTCQADYKDVKEQLKRFEVEYEAPRGRPDNATAQNYLTVEPWTTSNGMSQPSRIPRP